MWSGRPLLRGLPVTEDEDVGSRPLQLVLDPDVGLEIIDFIESNEVKSVVMVDRVIGCPHEEGID